MNLNEYLRERHPTVNALTRMEAKVVGISYPLQRGWVEKYGSLELPDEIVEKLRTAKAERYAKASYQKAKAKSIRERKPKDEVKKRPVIKLKRESKKAKKERADSLTKLVKTIVSQGCKDAERMKKHLNRPHVSPALHKMHAENMKHLKSI